jgi:hypothetical protein
MTKRMKKDDEVDEMQWRQMIAGYYRLALNNPPEKGYRAHDTLPGWEGDDGVIDHIQQHFGFDHGKRTQNRRIVHSIKDYSNRGCTYRGQRIMGAERKPLVTSPQEYQILIDSVEKEYGLVTAAHQINEYREEQAIHEFGLSITRRTMNRLGPVIGKVKRRKQGNRNPDSPWAKARLRWVLQLLFRLGKHKLCPAARGNEYLELTVTPKYFDNGELEPLSVYQNAFFDKCHKKTEIGRTGDTVYSFPRNEGGLYDKDGGIGDVDTKLH